jgi:formyl-CoA transferase
MNTIAEVAAEAQTGAIGLMQEVPGEDFSLLGLPISFDGERPAIRAGEPRLGGSPAARTS